MAIQYTCSIGPDGARIEARRRRLLSTITVPVTEWAAEPALVGSAARVLLGYVTRGAASADEKSILLTHEAAVSLPNSIATHVNIPDLSRHSVTLSFNGRVDTTDGTIRVRWFDQRARSVLAERNGAFIVTGNEIARLSRALFTLLQGVDAFNASVGAPVEVRIARWQPVQAALRDVTGAEVKADGFLGSLTIYQAGAFALDTRETADGVDFVPVLMSASKSTSLEDDAPVEEDAAGNETLSAALRDNDADALLPPELQKRFVDERLNAQASTRDAYVLGRNVFVVLDPDLKIALDVVRAMRKAPPDIRRGFIRNPRPAIAEALRRDDADNAAVGLFVETQQYSERVLGLGIWDPPKLPWVKKKTEQWAPETFPIIIEGRKIELTPDALDDVFARVETAKKAGFTEVDVEGTSYRVEAVEAATAGLRYEMENVTTTEPAPEIAEEKPVDDKNVLIIKQNVDGVEYQLVHSGRVALVARDFPYQCLAATRPKPHQTEGFDWLVSAWEAGWPGVLLADDMGLGKTFQALAFLAWVRTNQMSPRRLQGSIPTRGPFLIVAPTALLRNWVAEAELHLAVDVLGERIDAFGPGLKNLKRAKNADWTPEDSLDIDRLRSADWILTTYETLADNHRAFARVAYSVIIFDEMQKVKSPGTINTHAAKALNAEFVLGMTGTPIENRLEDLWCIMDRVAPGYLGDLKSFSATHTDEATDALKELKAKLDTPRLNLPAVMLRRMKEHILEGLPPKTIQTYKVGMPVAQSDAYARVIREAQSGERTPGAMLKVIHALRSISLHPSGGNDVDAYDPEIATSWIEESARLKQVFETLKRIEQSREKALVFVEHRDIQTTFAAAATTLLGLRTEPVIINGTTPGSKRQDIVDRFQRAKPGFDLLVLSPKAAGIGLTITAANHVIHLSRWWNPAVEDQCNDRVYRIGQSKAVTIHVPMAVHPALGDRSFDLNLDRLLNNKRALSRHMLAPPVSEADIGVLFDQAVGPS